MSQTDYDYSRDQAASAKRRDSIWPRVAYCIGFGIVGYAVLWLVFALAILQLIVIGVSGERNAQLAGFGAKIGFYLRDIVRYLLGSSDTTPFPFSPFPEA